VAFLALLAQRARENDESGKRKKRGELPHPQAVHLLLVLRHPSLVSMLLKQKNLHLLRLPRKRSLGAEEEDAVAELQQMALKLKFRIFFNAQKDRPLRLFRKMHPVR
jgi:hypothetical protein